MRRFFFTVFFWFWLTFVGVGLLFVALFSHGGLQSTRLLGFLVHNFLLFVIAGGIFCFFISSYLTKPLYRLSAAAAGIAEGRLDTRVDPSLRKRRDEIGRLAGNFDHMAEQIEALVTSQRRMLGDVSHELRSPLARLMVALSLVKTGPPEESAENLDRIGVEAGRLDTLIGQLLTLSRIDSGVDRGSRTRFDLTNLIHEVASDADFEARARNRRVVILQADALTIEGFEDVLRSAVENVVRNAVRHTAEGTAVEITLQRNPAGPLLRVRDHGPGVPEARIPEMFQPFRRVSSDNSDGAGLGLAIAERAVNLHGGTIRAANTPEGGLIVQIALGTAPGRHSPKLEPEP